MTLTEETRNRLIFGTSEIVELPIPVTAGPLSAEIDNGNVRYIRWRDYEVLRAISFIVRDTKWGTYRPALTNVRSSAGKESFRFSYDGFCDGPEGAFRYHAEIEGHADGQLSFLAKGSSDTGFATNRTGFVVLHGLDGVTGHDVEVEHTSGERSRGTFPDLVDPNQPILDIRALTHEPAPGLIVSVRMTGDAFEMEDQRNWTDASYKTYVRPLSRGFPYRIEKEETLEQAVELTVSDRRRAAGVARSSGHRAEIRGVSGIVPSIGLALKISDAERLAASRSLVSPGYCVLRLDGREPIDTDRLRTIAAIDARLDIDLVVAGRDIDSELAPLVTALAGSGLAPRRILVTPARDLSSRPANQLPPGEADYSDILAAARRRFPDVAIGGGTVVGFPEFSRNRPVRGVDFIAHSTQAIVHAADDRSVMETLEALPHVIATARAVALGLDYRLGPGTIGAPAEFYAVPPAANPGNVRMPTAEFDPRQKGLFAATFALGYAATAAAAGIGSITLGALSGSAGILQEDEASLRPVGTIIDALSRLAGQARFDIDVSGTGVVALGAAAGGENVVWLANLTASPITVEIAGATFARLLTIDADSLARGNGAGDWHGEPVRLNSYAVACLRS